MAAAVLGGLTVSTILGLLVLVPAFYLVTDDIKEWIGRRRGTKTPAPPVHEPAAEGGAGHGE